MTINDAYGAIHDITFENSLFKAQGRMGLECTSRPTTATTEYRNINILDSTFEPQGNEADLLRRRRRRPASRTVSRQRHRGRRQRPRPDVGLRPRDQRRQQLDGHRQPRSGRRAARIFNLQRHVTDAIRLGRHRQRARRLAPLPDHAHGALGENVVTLNVYGGTFTDNTVISASPGGSVAYLDEPPQHGLDRHNVARREQPRRLRDPHAGRRLVGQHGPLIARAHAYRASHGG